MRTAMRTVWITVLAMVGGMVAGVAEAAPIVTDPTLDTANDLMDIGGGTVFACDSLGVTSASGGGPWAVNASGNLSDNDVETRAYSVFNNLTPPVLVGVHSMPTAMGLAGFAITTDDQAFDWWMPSAFTIQGSNDSTDGYGGTWTDIFVYSGSRLAKDKTSRWNAADNTFLSSDAFTSFRLLTSVANEDYAEIEFFGQATTPQIELSSEEVAENATVVGTVSVALRDTEEFVYSLTDGYGNNGNFEIVPGTQAATAELRAKVPFDYETVSPNPQLIKIEAEQMTDNGSGSSGDTYDLEVSIDVTNVIEPFGGPVATAEATKDQTLVGTLESVLGDKTSVAYAIETAADIAFNGSLFQLTGASSGTLEFQDSGDATEGAEYYLTVSATFEPGSVKRYMLIKVTVVSAASHGQGTVFVFR